MQLFFSDITNNRVNFSLDEKKHLTKVLRKKVDDEISVIDGKGYLYHNLDHLNVKYKCHYC